MPDVFFRHDHSEPPAENWAILQLLLVAQNNLRVITFCSCLAISARFLNFLHYNSFNKKKTHSDEMSPRYGFRPGGKEGGGGEGQGFSRIKWTFNATDGFICVSCLPVECLGRCRQVLSALKWSQKPPSWTRDAAKAVHCVGDSFICDNPCSTIEWFPHTESLIISTAIEVRPRNPFFSGITLKAWAACAVTGSEFPFVCFASPLIVSLQSMTWTFSHDCTFSFSFAK